MAPKKDLNQAAFDTLKAITGTEPAAMPSALDSAQLRREIMREMGRRGGKKGGKARARSLSPEQRTEIAKMAAKRRWDKKPKK